MSLEDLCKAVYDPKQLAREKKEKNMWSSKEEMALMMTLVKEETNDCQISLPVAPFLSKEDKRRKQSKFQKTLERIEKYKYLAKKQAQECEYGDIKEDVKKAFRKQTDGLHEIFQHVGDLLHET